MSIVSKFLGPWIIKDAWWGDWQFCNPIWARRLPIRASDVLKELYGVLELMTVYMLRLGILGWYIYFKDNSKLD